MPDSLLRQRRSRVGTTPAATAQAHGRLAKVAPAARVVVDLADAAERYAQCLVDLALARHLGDLRGQRNSRTRADRARAALVQGRPGGQDEAQRIGHALASGGGACLRAVERAHPDHREYAARAAVRLVALVREHDIRSTAALLLVASAASWTALADLLRERAFAASPAALSVSTSKPGAKEGERVTLTLGGMGDLLGLAAKASATARGDLLSGLALEAQNRENGGPGTDRAQEERIRQAVASMQARRAENERLARERAEGEPDEEDAPEGEPDDGDAAQAVEPAYEGAAPLQRPDGFDPGKHAAVMNSIGILTERIERARGEGDTELVPQLEAQLVPLRRQLDAMGGE